jgi:hypothetical protein
VELIGPDGWRSGPLLVARSWSERLGGVRGLPDGWGVLLAARSIHTFGVRSPLAAAGLDRAGTVIWSRAVPPGRVVATRAAWVLELAAGRNRPRPGWRLDARPILAG